jgi:hypothetical protein
VGSLAGYRWLQGVRAVGVVLSFETGVVAALTIIVPSGR